MAREYTPAVLGAARRVAIRTDEPAWAATVSLTDRLALAEYVASLAVALRLSDWEIDIDYALTTDEQYAEVDAPFGQRRATIRLSSEFFHSSPEEQRDTVVHELVHLILWPTWSFVDEMFDETMTAKQAKAAWKGFVQTMEYATDQVAAVVAPDLPMPPTLTSGPNVDIVDLFDSRQARLEV